jgi:HSP20 family protein
MQLAKWKPFKEMNNFFNGINTNNLLPTINGNDFLFNNWEPAVDVTESDKEFLLKFEVPGIDKKDIDVEIQNGTVTVSGEKKYEKKDDKKHCIECFYGNFSRSFTLPENVNEKNIKAEQINGVLSLHLKKSKENVVTSKKIEVK